MKKSFHRTQTCTKRNACLSSLTFCIALYFIAKKLHAKKKKYLNKKLNKDQGKLHECCKTLFSFRNTTIIVELENVNDNTPSFTQQTFFFTVTEGMHNGNSKVVGQVTATDKDQDENNSVYGQIKYEFVNQTSKWIT